jgi:hypothetical protein
LLQSQTDLSLVEQEIIIIWNSVENYTARELLVTVYRNFLRNVYSTMHIYFFVQSHRIIDQVVNGDQAVSNIVQGGGE